MVDDDDPFCYTCVSSGHWQECESCDHGWVERDWDDYFADDVSIERCQWCDGKGGWWVCLGHEWHDLEPGSIHRVPLAERPIMVNFTQIPLCANQTALT